MSKKWYDALPKDLQKIVDEDGAKAAAAVNPWEVDFYTKQREVWTQKGGELISLPADEQATMMKTFASIGEDLSKERPAIKPDFDIFATAANAAK